MRICAAIGLIAGLVLLAAVPARAEIGGDAMRTWLFADQADWQLSFPTGDWVLLPHKTHNGNNALTYIFSGQKNVMFFSVRLDPDGRCVSNTECRTQHWAQAKGGFAGPKDIVDVERNSFAVKSFYIYCEACGNFYQRNVLAHRVEKGIWMDIHISTIDDAGPPDPAAILDFIGTMRIEPRE